MGLIVSIAHFKRTRDEAQKKVGKIEADGVALYEFSEKTWADELGIAGETNYHALQEASMAM